MARPGFPGLPVGVVGLRRGRRDPEQLAVGGVPGFWRLEVHEPGQRPWAEIKLAGRAWLQFGVQADAGGGGSTIRQTAISHPPGLLGLPDRYGLHPLHARLFQGMPEIRKQVKACNRS